MSSYLKTSAQRWARLGISSKFPRQISSTARCLTNHPVQITNLKDGPGLRDFINVTRKNTTQLNEELNIPYLDEPIKTYGENRKVFLETYGCQMNVNDTEVVWSILKNNGFQKTDEIKLADVILVVTCAVREGAETKIWNRIQHLGAMKKNRSHKSPLQIGILGCMAERLKTQLLEKEQCIDIVAGPDSYRDLPRLLAITRNGPRAANVLLSLDETYADIMPVRLNEGAVSAFVSIMRGCDNMCSYCIVPFTRGRERSRDISSIIQEVLHLHDTGVKEITLLGQNVNSYRDLSSGPSMLNADQTTHLSNPGFRTVYKNKVGGQRFADLLHKLAHEVPEMRIRFTSPHPKDFPDEVLQVIKENKNICKSLHLPAQSGSSKVLERMRRGYTREAYLELVSHIRSIIPDIALTSDFICGFCGETEEDFQETLTLMKNVKYHVAYLFAYSMREKTTAHRRYTDDVPEEIKARRLRDMIKVYREDAEILLKKDIGKHQLILIEGISKRSPNDYYGRNDQNIKVIIPNKLIHQSKEEYINHKHDMSLRETKIGDFVAVQIKEANSQILKAVPLYHSTINQFYST